ncbi:hypothetical protein ACJ41O_012012 [Fusarium nematophilum]
MSLPHGLVAFGPSANCTLQICPLEASILKYRPSIPANAIFIAIFTVSMVAHVIQGIRARMWGFMLSMLTGCAFEIVGYVGRLILYDNPFSFVGFVMQIVAITVAPVFFCSAIYVLLSQVANHVDRSVSRLPPRLYYWIFIPCDIVSLFLQAAGASASVKGDTYDDIQLGVDISLAGLVFQVVTLVAFCTLFIDYLSRCRRSPERYKLTKPVKTFLGFMFASISFVLLRCVYRIVELHEGYFSALFRDEPLFIALESVAMCIAVVCLNLGHPGKVFGRRTVSKTHSDDGNLRFLIPSSDAVSMENVNVKK